MLGPFQNFDPSVFLIVIAVRKLVDAPPGCRYVALSYVLGKTNNNTATSSAPQASMSPKANDKRFEKVIEDSITVTQALGLQYLWIDKICIDHSDYNNTRHQIRQMDLIYANSDITIIVAACNTPDEGSGVTLKRFWLGWANPMLYCKLRVSIYRGGTWASNQVVFEFCVLRGR